LATAERSLAAAPPARRRRGGGLGWLDLLVLAVLVMAGIWLAWRVQVVLVYNWDWGVVPRFLVRVDRDSGQYVPNLLLTGFLVTIRLTVWGGVLAAIIGTTIGLCRLSPNLFLRLLSQGYVLAIRNVPPLIFIFIFYFFISSQLMPSLGLTAWTDGLGSTGRTVLGYLFGPPRQLEAFISGVLCLAMFEAAYVAEIVRAGVQSVPRGQWEAAASLGLTGYERMRFIVLPQALQKTVPPLASQFISLIKDSSIVSLISVPELTFMASQTVSSTRRVFEIWITVAVLYFALCFLLSLLFGRLEKRLAAGR
jgi:polar amino acid transport system permease protein